jgi:MFS family permease
VTPTYLLYRVVGIPIAWLADRYNGVNIIGFSLILWSSFTVLSGFATSFWQLAILQVGIGEASGSPLSHSISSDLFDKTERAKALTFNSLGIMCAS